MKIKSKLFSIMLMLLISSGITNAEVVDTVFVDTLSVDELISSTEKELAGFDSIENFKIMQLEKVKKSQKLIELHKNAVENSQIEKTQMEKLWQQGNNIMENLESTIQVIQEIKIQMKMKLNVMKRMKENEEKIKENEKEIKKIEKQMKENEKERGIFREEYLPIEIEKG